MANELAQRPPTDLHASGIRMHLARLGALRDFGAARSGLAVLLDAVERMPPARLDPDLHEELDTLRQLLRL